MIYIHFDNGETIEFEPVTTDARRQAMEHISAIYRYRESNVTVPCSHPWHYIGDGERRRHSINFPLSWYVGTRAQAHPDVSVVTFTHTHQHAHFMAASGNVNPSGYGYETAHTHEHYHGHSSDHHEVA